MKRLLTFLLIVGLVIGSYYAFRLSPLVLTDNAGSDKVVLLHGLGRSEMAMLLMESELTEAGFDVHSIGYPSTEKSPDALIEIISKEINNCCVAGPETVHFVGHSLGGLLIRAYLGQHKPDSLGRVVLLGTPNKGSELANAEAHQSVPNSILEMAGPTAMALSTGPTGFPASLPAPYYPVGVVAGTQDTAVANKWLPLPNDGLVSVESARLEGMSDFITFDVTHWELRSDPGVVEQVVAFLSNEAFDRTAP
ncbi:MAG: alpha/beta fold hydrolase [Woeseiaceae bacterium]|nr:alpha/beta fold hydrolase [Woeseiaceae bacterium]